MTARMTHAEASSLLPWYVNGTLEPSEHDAVRAHLADCAECRAECALLHEVQSATVAAAGEPAAEPSPPRSRVPAPVTRWRRTWWLTPRPVRWAVAAQAAALAGLVVWGALGPSPGGALYGTLDEPAAAASDEVRPRLQLIFADDVRAARLRDLLLAHGLRLVDGPSPLGVYTVELEAAAVDGVDAVAQDLRGRPEIRLADPLP